MRIAVLGGGPAGLTAAQLIKQQHPHWDVTLFERQTPENTFGYGVGLGWSALKALADSAPYLVADLEAASISVDTWTIRRGSGPDAEAISAANSHGLGISRELLLNVLRRHAQRAGVEVRTGTHTTLADVADADVVLAADGVGSETRATLADHLGVTCTPGELAFLWCGADISRPEMTLCLKQTSAGPLAAHVMPYNSTCSTFQVDAMTDTIRALAEACLEPDDGAASLTFLQEQYADVLGGSRLRAKRPAWQVFETIACEQWSSGNVVLLGDAAHTAHYTVGSGTGLATEDAVCLAEALAGAGSLTDAFCSYQSLRQPRVRKLQDRAARSQLWWSSMAQRMDNPLPQVLLGYLSRTGAVSLAALAKVNADLIHSMLPGVPCDERLADAILVGKVVPDAGAVSGAGRRDLEITQAPTLQGLRALIEDLRVLPDDTMVRLNGPATADAVLDRLDVAEHLRAGTKLTTIVAARADAKDTLALGVLTGRTDLVEIS